MAGYDGRSRRFSGNFGKKFARQVRALGQHDFSMTRNADADLLQLEMDTLWGCDAYGRFEPYPLAAAAVANDGQMIRFGAAVAGDSAQRFVVEDSVASDPESVRADQPPAVLLRHRELLAPLGEIKLAGGPSYVFDSLKTGLLYCGASDFRVVTSRDEIPSTLATARPEAWWEPHEWADLLAGRLGPWAIGTAADRVVTLCHTPVASLRAAEAGVWTHPDERGRGYASIVTAAWAMVAGDQFDTLFYSTAADNGASRSVARKLQLRPIGWIWQLREGKR